ncbi:MAG TPA: pyridoxal-phosphate dependent enzyme, partial [Candidatus Dormibacteraeota bacterium]|nr:pyridoxal-phosphate dependent enzyme [Candidatus Dormibacteraeota bacterium]
MDFSLDEILEANQRCLRAGIHAPLLHLAGREVWLKAECLQPTGSFKVRGFLNAALSLEPENLARGLMTVSAGNAALACAYVANTLGVGCRVLTFDTIPAPKLAGIRAWGAEAVLRPRAEILDWMNQRGWESEQEAFIHPFLDRAVIAGSGGIGVELLAELPALARLLVPVGGGGLIAGIAIAVKAMRPSVEIIGVQSSGYPAWEVAMATGLSPVLPPQTIADGTTAPIDAGMLELLPTLVDRWV